MKHSPVYSMQHQQVITLSMVLGVALCCLGLRVAQRHVRELKGYKKTARDDSFRPGFEEDEDEDEVGNSTEKQALR